VDEEGEGTEKKIDVASVYVAVLGDGRGAYPDELADEEGEGTEKKMEVASVYVFDVVLGEGDGGRKEGTVMLLLEGVLEEEELPLGVGELLDRRELM
jgi:hypothetical protein